MQGHPKNSARVPKHTEMVPKRIPKRCKKRAQNDPQTLKMTLPPGAGAPKRIMQKTTTNHHQSIAQDPGREPNGSQEHAKQKQRCAQGRPMDGKTFPKGFRAL